MKKLAFGSCLAVWLCSGLAAPCAAAPVTFAFTGTVADGQVSPADTSGIVIEAGMRFSGSYTFESTAPDDNSAPRGANYFMQGAPYGMTFSLGAFTTSLSVDMEISTWQANPGNSDQYSASGCWDAFCSENASMHLRGLDDTLLESGALPLTPPLLAALESNYFRYNHFFPDAWEGTSFAGTIDSLVCSAGCDPVVGAPVPEPGTLLLIGPALAALGLRRRRHQCWNKPQASPNNMATPL
jgi:hypothetical protein